MSIAGIETGGTKIVCAVAARDDLEHPTDVERFPTTTPDETFARINAFLDRATAAEPIEALGLASFGPVDSDRRSARFGRITTTPKPGWRDTDVLAAIPLAATVPTDFLHDVGAAALGELRFGAGRGAADVAYITVGTGVGAGIVVGERALGGSGWPELGHLLVRRHPDDDFAGSCPYHGDCLEGLAAGPAVKGRWGTDASSLPTGEQEAAVAILAFYIAQLVWTIVLTVGSRRVVLGGGVMFTPGLRERVQSETRLLSAGYGPAWVRDDTDLLVRAPELESLSGVVGAMVGASDLLSAR